MQRRQGEEREFSAGSMTYSAHAALQYLSTPKLPHLHFPPFQDGGERPKQQAGRTGGRCPDTNRCGHPVSSLLHLSLHLNPRLHALEWVVCR